MRKLLSLLAILSLVVVLAACGDDDDDDGGGDSTDESEEAAGGSDEFCEQAEDLEVGTSGAELEDEEAIEALEDLVDEAPEDVQDDFETLLDAAEELQELSDSTDIEDIGGAFDTAFDPELIEASAGIAEFLVEECDIEVEGAEDLSDLTDISDAFSDFSDLSDSDVPDDFGASGLRDFWEAEYAGEPFVDAISGIGSVNLGDVQEFTLTPDQVLSDDDALAACEATLDYAETNGVEVSVIVQGVAEAGGEEPVLVTAEDGGECEPA